jgi:Fic family protein
MYLRTSRYVPPRWEAVRGAMSALFDLLEREPEASVRAVLGQWMFGYIHPYLDGNGRMARFPMNAMLASGGYPWTVIEVGDRTDYLSALDRASIDMNFERLAESIAMSVARSAKQNEARGLSVLNLLLMTRRSRSDPSQHSAVSTARLIRELCRCD